MVLGVALRDVLNQGAIVREEVRRNVDSLCVPDLAVFQAKLLWAQSRQESQLRSNTEVGDYDIESLVEQLVLAYLGHQVVSSPL